jgi:CRP-like cAMP-binding protein
MHFTQALRETPQMNDAQSSDFVRTISRHTLAYVLCSISELFRHYNFDPLDLLIIHAILNANVLNVMKDPKLDRKFSSMHAVEPDDIKQGISRVALSRFLNLPIETVRRRVDRLKRRNILSEGKDGLIVTERNRFKFGNNHELQKTNVVLVRKLLRDLRQAGITRLDDL